MSEERFIAIEMRLAHQDRAIDELDAAIARQQDSITKLERLCASLAEKLASLDDRAPRPGDERPPHY